MSIDIEKHQLLPPEFTPARDQTCNLGMYPDWESDPQPFNAWDDAPTN